MPAVLFLLIDLGSNLHKANSSSFTAIRSTISDTSKINSVEQAGLVDVAEAGIESQCDQIVVGVKSYSATK